MIERLTKRRDFLAAAKGKKAARRAFILETLQREDSDAPRFGFTVSKRIAKSAVERNRIRRRLKEAVRLAAPDHARPGHDYVVIGRRSALDEPFGSLKSEIASALEQASARSRQERGAKARNQVQ
jgi:ribonuclease P protein component